MKKLLLSFLALVAGVAAFGQAANDMIITQRKADNSGSIQRNVPTQGAISTTLASYISAIGLGVEDSPQFANVRVSDTNASHYLQLSAGSDLTQNRTLTLTTGDAARTLTLTGNATLNQDVSTTGTPTFASLSTGSGAISGGAGSFTTLTASVSGTFGTGASATNGIIVLNGSSDNNYGAVIRFNRNSVLKWQLGNESGITGGASDAFILYDQVGAAIGLKYTTSTGLAVTGTSGATGNVWSGNNGFVLGSGTTDGAYLDSTGVILASISGDSSLRLRRRTSDGNIATFWRDTTNVGTISVTTTATAYNTSSDARLKTNIRDLTNSGAIIDALKPRIFDWKSGEKDSIGFVAQELYAAYPQAVTKGDDGATVTQQWSVDFSKLVPVLVAEVKSLRARVAELEAKK